MLESSYYFSLKSSFSQSLFKERTFVWEPLIDISSFLQGQKLGESEVAIPDGVFIENRSQVFIGAGVKIEPGVYIKGPAFIGKGCTLRQGAYIRENVVLEENVVVGHCSEIKNSILLSGSQVAHFNYVGDSILGASTGLGAGVICSNFRLDQKEIWIKIGKKKIQTGLRKLGLILGDDSKIGCNSVMNPGTLVGKNVLCDPCVNLKGVVSSHMKVKLESNYSIGA